MTLGDLLSKFKGKLPTKSGLVGITMSEQNIALAYIHHKEGSPTLSCCENLPVSSPEERQSLLQAKVNELGLQGTRCNYVLEPSDYKLLLIEAPKVEPQEMEAAVKWKIKDSIDIPLEDVVLSVFNIPEDAYRNQNEMLYVVASRKSKIIKIIEFMEASGLKLDVIDIPELSMRNLSVAYTNDENGLAFIELLGTGSTMNMSKQGSIYLSRHLNTSVDQDIMNSHQWDSVKDRLILEIQRSLDYYESQMGQRQISKLLLAPRQHDSESIEKELDQSMAIKVETMDLAQKLNSPKDLPLELQQACMMAIGGALRLEQVAA